MVTSDAVWPRAGRRTRGGPTPVGSLLGGLIRVEAEDVPVLVHELSPPAEELSGWLFGEAHAASRQLTVRGVDVVGLEDEARVLAKRRAALAEATRQHDLSGRAGRRHREPAHPVAHRRVVALLEAQALGVEAQGCVLIRHVDSDDANVGDGLGGACTAHVSDSFLHPRWVPPGTVNDRPHHTIARAYYDGFSDLALFAAAPAALLWTLLVLAHQEE